MELSPSQGHESTSVTLGVFIADSVGPSLRSGGGMRELSPSQGHESTSVTLGYFIEDSPLFVWIKQYM
jgi:hypothetical protein